MKRRQALARAVDFVCGLQEADGSWREWRLPPGESRMWTTAYLGYRLASVDTTADGALAVALGRAAGWLQSSTHPGGGWGYSAIVGPDADSTALATLFLRRVGAEVAASAVDVLTRHQQGDGGFATFTPAWGRGAWIASHPDVTATAVAALSLVPCDDGADRRARAIAYLQRQQTANGLWMSYWWTSPLYATEAVLAARAAVGESVRDPIIEGTLDAWRDASSFETALRLLALAHIGAANGEAARACVDALTDTQDHDGGWAPSAELRLTDRHVYEPWLYERAGPTFIDERRLFTTATAVAALGTFREGRA